MKENFLFVSLAFLCVTLGYSQSTITLNSSNFPKPGDSSDIKVYTIPATQSFIDSTAANDSLTIDETLEKALEAINDKYMKTFLMVVIRKTQFQFLSIHLHGSKSKK